MGGEFQYNIYVKAYGFDSCIVGGVIACLDVIAGTGFRKEAVALR